MTIIADTSAIFPACPTFGFTAEPALLVKIVAREGGYERRQREWARFLRKYTAVPLGDQSQDDIEEVLNFWYAMGAMATAFRFKDWMDFKSCRLKATPAATDMPLISSEDSPAKYRLVKEYSAGAFTQLREIQRPNAATITIANEVGASQTDWSLDEATGLVSIGGSFSGTPTSWGGEFWTWVRFDAQLNPAFSNHQIMNVTVQLTELRQPLT